MVCGPRHDVQLSTPDHINEPKNLCMPTHTRKNPCLIKGTPHLLGLIHGSGFPMACTQCRLSPICVCWVGADIHSLGCVIIATLILIGVREIWFSLCLARLHFIHKYVDVVSQKEVIAVKHTCVANHTSSRCHHALQRVIAIEYKHTAPGSFLLPIHLGNHVSILAI